MNKLEDESQYMRHFQRIGKISSPYGKNAPEILSKLRGKSHPNFARLAVLGLIQLYFDGIICSPKFSRWKSEEKGLNELLETGKLTISSFYRGSFDESVMESVRRGVFSVEKQILRASRRFKAKGRHLAGYEARIAGWGVELSEIEKLAETDTIVPVMSDGLEPALLAADIIENARILPMRYSHASKRDDEVMIPRRAASDWVENGIKGKNVLVIEGVSSNGASLREVIDYVAEHDPSSICFSTVMPLHGDLYATKGIVEGKIKHERFARIKKRTYEK